VLSDRDDVGACDLGDGDTAVGLVGGIEVDVVGTDTSSDGELEVLGLGKALCCEVTGVETVDGCQPCLSFSNFPCCCTLK
jgi:hypothetical protein